MAADWSVLLGAAREEAARFGNALADPAGAQRALLARIVADNAGSAFGREHDFAGITDIARWQARMPVRGHAELAGWIDRAASGEPGVLTGAPVIAFEETGGTRSGGKLIPYTAAGLAGFRDAVLPWLASLAKRRPEAFAGRTYVTISPATRQPRSTAGGIAIGLDSDAAYLGADLAPSFAALLAVPPDTGRIADPADWQIATLRALVTATDLSFVSLWSPTFLLALVEALEPRAEDVLAGLDPAGRRRLTRALAGPEPDTAMLWPALDCISCWRDGASAGFAQRLGAVFPHAAIDAKGLLATEAAVTVPYGENGACVPSLTSTVIEFRDADSTIHLCDTVRPGESYRVIVTTASGLYRYDLGDIVECVDRRGRVPVLRFVGRGDAASDLVGEKLEEGFVAGILATLPAPATLIARTDPPGYRMLCAVALAEAEVAAIDAALCANPQYAHARAIGQLAPLSGEHRPRLVADLTRAGLAAGRRMGDVKPVALMRQADEYWMES